MAVSTLPRIIRIVDSFDSGEFGAATCPHCGADCRYYKTFDAVTPEGTIVRLGAAAGCIKLFPSSKLAEIHAYILDKARGYEKKGWSLNRSDAQILDIIDAVAKGERDESAGLREVLDIRTAMAQWRKNRR